MALWAGGILLCAGLFLGVARIRAGKALVKTDALVALRNEADRFRLVAEAWETVCRGRRHPTWAELDRIVFIVGHGDS